MSTTDWWMCIADPASLLHRLGHEGRDSMPLLSAASRMVRLKKKTWSASSTGSPWRRLISTCAGAVLLDHRVDLEALRLGEIVDVVDHLVVLVDAGIE